MPTKYNHNKNVINEQASAKSKIQSGDIVMFNYSGKKVTTKRPMVLVLHPNWRGYLHGLNIDYIPESTLKKLWEMTKVTLAGKVERLTKLRLPLLKADIGNPQTFYNQRLKKFLRSELGKTGTAYRTYTISAVGSIKKVDYRFQDSAYTDETQEELESKK